MPFSSVSRAPGKIAAVGVVAVDVGGEAVAVAVLVPPSHSAMMSMKSLRTMSLSAPQEIRSALPSSASIVSLPPWPK